MILRKIFTVFLTKYFYSPKSEFCCLVTATLVLGDLRTEDHAKKNLDAHLLFFYNFLLDYMYTI